jgi:AcrR family transcriptional regulator
MIRVIKTRRRQPAVTRRAILESAGAEFARHGYAGTGLEAAAKCAELAKGALFHHFSVKRTGVADRRGGAAALDACLKTRRIR